MRAAIGIDIGGTKIRAARVTEDGRILTHLVRPTPNSRAGIFAEIYALVAELDHGVIVAVGAGIPGRVDTATGAILSDGFVDLAGAPLVKHLRSISGRPVFIDNDAAMALVAEARIGAGRTMQHVVLLTIGTGIGGAALEKGRIIHGRATAGQLGHVTVDVNGGICVCGRRGCIETTSSGTALRRLIAASGLPATTSIEDILQDPGPVAAAIIQAWAGPLRLAIDSLVAVIDPECVILGGGLGAAACVALARNPPASPWFQYAVVPAALGDDAGVIGAALAALEHGT